MKKVLSSLLAVGLVFSLASGVSASPNENAKGKHAQEFHIGEKPVKTFKDEKTGVVVDVYESSDQSAEPMVMSLTSGWDLLGSEYWTMNGTMNWYWDSIYYSTGGDYMFRVPAHDSLDPDWLSESQVILYENDGAGQNTRVISWVVRPQSVSYDYVVRSIGGYVDGTNNRAEFHTFHQAGYDVSGDYIPNVRYYD